jgi:hypothetical protein
MNLYNTLLHYVLLTCKKYNIDESHSALHSMNVFDYAHDILESEINKNPLLEEHRKIIYCAAITHDMCDKKYRNETEALDELKEVFMKTGELTSTEIGVILHIISTMSYSKVIKKGYPNMEEKYMLPYHIVREADLLSAYDVNRCFIYQMTQKRTNYMDSIDSACELFEGRVLQYIEKDLFVTDFAKRAAAKLHTHSLLSLNRLRNRVSI